MFAALSRAASFVWLLVTLPAAVVFLSDRAALGIASSAALFHLVGGLSIPVLSTLVRSITTKSLRTMASDSLLMPASLT